jgi:outer membrane protein TolC
LIPHLAFAQATSAPSTIGAPAPTAQASPAPGGMTLEQAVKYTLSRNENAKISDLRVVVADAAVEKAFTAFLPVVTATGNDLQHAYPSTATTPDNIGTASLTVNQPLFNASSFPLYAYAKDLADAQRSQNVDDRRLLGYAAANAFFTVLNAQDVVQASTRQLDNAKSNLADTQARADAKLSSSNDVTKAQVDAASAGTQAETAKGNLDNFLVQLGFTINAPVPSNLVPPTATLAAAERTPGAPDQLVKLAIDHRPDVLVAKYQVTAAHHYASEPLLRTVPTLGLLAGSALTSFSPANHWNDETVQATLTWTLYDAGVRYSDLHSRDASADIAELTLQYLERSVDAQVKAAVAILVAAQAAFHVSAEGMKWARQNVDETAILYRQGLATALELVDANDSRFTAEIAYATAEFGMAQAYLTLRQALGLDALGTELR